MNGAAVMPFETSSNARLRSAGRMLRDTRELKGISQEKAASDLNLMLSHIVALESDAYNPHLEGKHFAAYVKSYAAYLELNPQVLFGLYAGSTAVDAMLDEDDDSYFIPTKSGSSGFGVRSLTVFGLLGFAWLMTAEQSSVVALVDDSRAFISSQSSIVRAWIQAKPSFAQPDYAQPDYVQPEYAQPDPTEPGYAEPQASNAERSPTSAGYAAQNLERQINAMAPAAGGADPAIAEAARQRLSDLGFASTDGSSVDSRRAEIEWSDPASSLGTIRVEGEDVLNFTFSDNCWLEVYDSQQNPIVMETRLAGESLQLAGTAPFEVRVGNSRAVNLSLNGEPVAITQHPTIDSTELIVGGS